MKSPGMLLSLIFISAVLTNRGAYGFRAVTFNLPKPPVLQGPLAPNTLLRTAEQVHKGKLNGPASIVNDGENVYVATIDSKIYNVAKCEPQLIVDMKPAMCRSRQDCGQLMSIKKDPIAGGLMALDTFRGLYHVDVSSGLATLLFDAKLPVAGRAPVHLNDFVITSSGYVIMSDSSDTYNVDRDVYIGVEGRKSGRLILFVPASGKTYPLLSGLVFPNGLALSDDGQSLLVTETSMARVLKVSLQSSSWLTVTPFATNLPGLPDNIRRSDHGTFWVPMFYPRHTSVPNPLDWVANMDPGMRAMGVNGGYVTLQRIKGMFGRWAIAVEIDVQGNIIRSLQDPKNVAMSGLTEVSDYGGVLYIGSTSKFLGRIVEGHRQTSKDAFVQIALSRCLVTENQLPQFRQHVDQTSNSIAPVV